MTERLESALEGMRLETGAPATVTGESARSQRYGLLDRVSGLGIELVAPGYVSPRGLDRPLIVLLANGFYRGAPARRADSRSVPRSIWRSRH